MLENILQFVQDNGGTIMIVVSVILVALYGDKAKPIVDLIQKIMTAIAKPTPAPSPDVDVKSNPLIDTDIPRISDPREDLITAVTSADRVIKYLEAKGGTGVQDARNAAKAIFDPPVNQ